MSRDALIVGTSQYQNLPNLCAPAHDAEDVARCLENFGECRVVRLPEAIQDQRPIISQRAEVTTQMLEAALIRLFKPSGKNVPQTAIFYFSGHGLQRNAGIQEGYLATSDTNPETGNYGLSLYWLRRLLQESPVRQRVIILDCCNSGEFFNVLEADPGAKAGTDRLFMAASREYEEAYEALTSSHSVFTEALLSGLNPYKVKGGIVNGHHLIDNVNKKLKGELQQPLFESSGTEIVLTRFGEKGCHSAQPAEVSALDRLKQVRYKYCPFQGLNPFDTIHADFFFGREELTRSLAQMVEFSRFTLVTGASGIGKTSLLRAGLIHSLSGQNQAQQGIQWDIRYVSLDFDPLKQLAEAFVDPQVKGLQRAEQIRTAESFFQNRVQGMTQLVQATLNRRPTNGMEDRRILLVVDQFEALFTPSHDGDIAAQRKAVLDCLTAVANKTHVPIHIVLGMRSQYLQSLEAYPEFYDLAAKHCLVVPALTYDQLKSTIVGPLDKIGLQYDANLIYTLLLDAVGSPGELPLLQMALKELWQHREHQAADHLPPRLTLETYVQLGGVRNILRQHATEVIDKLLVTEKPVAQRILLSMGEFGDGSTSSRRQVEQEELVTPSLSVEQVAVTASKLVAARLLITHADYTFKPGVEASVCQAVPTWSREPSSTPQVSILGHLFQEQDSLSTYGNKTEPYFEICHDSLLNNWPVYESWLEEYRPIMRLQRSIEAAAMEWQQHQQPNHAEFFLSQTRLAEATSFQANHGEHLSALAHEYLGICHQHARKTKRKRYLMRLLIPVSMATGMLTAYSYNQLTQPDYSKEPGSENPANRAPGIFTPASQPGAADAFEGQVTADHGRGTRTAASTARYTPHASSGIALGPMETKQPEVPHPLRPLGQPLSQTMEKSQTGIDTWQETPVKVPISSTAAARGFVPAPVSFGEGDLKLQPVAQWISPADPNILIQVWCIHNAPEPACFTSSTTLNAISGLTSAPLDQLWSGSDAPHYPQAH